MKRDWFLTAAVSVLSLLLALVVLRVVAPELLGGSQSLRLVRASREVPPFFDNVFRLEDVATIDALAQDHLREVDLLLDDPYTYKRGRPLFPGMRAVGPHDLLGFRNASVPNIADVVVIGDSQTYGNNAVFLNSWPQQLARRLIRKRPTVYAMATGGWAAAQYLQMAGKAVVFQPRVVVVAFYSGNDAMESFQLIYGSENWASLRPDTSLSASDAPRGTFPPPSSQQWPVRFADGVTTVFTPDHRLLSNAAYPAVAAGYSIMADVARRIGELYRDQPVQLIFTVIPSKELVYAKKVAAGAYQPPAAYGTLIRREAANIGRLAAVLRQVPGARYVDLLAPMQKAALGAVVLYPSGLNGHPLASGYGLIAALMAPAIGAALPTPPTGGVRMTGPDGQVRYYLVRDGALWLFDSATWVTENGWALEEIVERPWRDVAKLPMQGVIAHRDRSRFGPLPTQ